MLLHLTLHPLPTTPHPPQSYHPQLHTPRMVRPWGGGSEEGRERLSDCNCLRLPSLQDSDGHMRAKTELHVFVTNDNYAHFADCIRICLSCNYGLTSGKITLFCMYIFACTAYSVNSPRKLLSQF